MNITHALQILIKAVAKTGALDETGKKVSDLGKDVSGLQSKMSSLGKLGSLAVKTGLTLPFTAASAAGRALVSVLRTLEGALGKISIVGLSLVGILASLTAGFAGVVVAAMPMTAELEGMRNAMWGIAGEAAPAMLEALRENSFFMSTERDLLKQYNMGYMLLGETLAKRIPEAYQYLSKVALATGDEVSWLMERLTRSVGRLSTRWMAYIGTVVSMEEAQAWAAQTTGKLIEELTREEIQAAMLERVLMRLEARTSSLPAPTETLMQRIKQLKAEFITLRTDLSDHFLPAAKALYANLIKIVKAFQALVREGGALYGPLRKLSALFTVLFELAGEGIEKLLGLADKGAAGLEDFIDKLLEAGWKAVEWGANIIVNLAIGMIQGASTALVGAMNFIAGLLEYWLGPGSAPRIVSNILDWGASAFTEFLRGFTMANFDILEGVQRPLKRALDVLVGLDMLSAVGAGELFIGLSEKMAAAIEHFRETGEILEGVFADLTSQIGGGYGAALAELWQRQLNLAIAVERLAAAELRLKNAREGEEAAQTKLSKAAREYNKLIREGADPAILRAKLKGVKADYDSLEAARKETEEAEEAEKLAKEEMKRRKEQVKLQERLLNQLILMGKALIDLEKARRKEIGEDPYELPPIEWPEVHPPKIDEAFEALKDRIRAKFDELWAMIRTKWEESGVMESIGRLQEAWERLKTAIAPVFTWLGERYDDLKAWAADEAWPWILDQWEKWGIWWDDNGPKIKSKISDIATAVRDWVVEDLWAWVLGEWDMWVEWWEIHGPTVKGAFIDILTSAETLTKALWILITGDEGWNASWEDAEKTLSWFWKQTKILASGGLAQLRNALLYGIALIHGDWRGMFVALQRVTIDAWITLERLTGGKLSEWWQSLKRYIDDPNKFLALGGGAVDWMLQGFASKWLVLLAHASQMVRDWIELMKGYYSGFWNLGDVLMDSLIGAIKNKATQVADSLRDIINRAIDAAKRALGFGSPSKVFIGLGESIVTGFTAGIEKLMKQPALAVGRMASLTIPAIGMAAGAGGYGAGQRGVQITIVNRFGPDSIRSDRDILKMVEQQQRALTLRGVRDVIQ